MRRSRFFFYQVFLSRIGVDYVPTRSLFFLCLGALTSCHNIAQCQFEGVKSTGGPMSLKERRESLVE
jgi:hypothetical protein